MSISSVSLVLPVVSPIASTPVTDAASSSAPAAATLSTVAVDTVTLSQEAQQLLSAGEVAPPDGSSQPDAVTQAISLLNNTDGSVAVDDQLQAYALTVNFVRGPITDTAFDPSKSGAMVALLDSPFAQHVQQVLNEVDSQKEMYLNATNGNQSANALDSSLATFNALSATDQQIYVSANNLRLQMDGGASLGTADDYRANQEAQADVDRALQATMSDPAYATALSKTTNAVSERILDVGQNFINRTTDLGVLAAAAGDQATIKLVDLAQSDQVDTADWTQQVQAYFAANGPPPAPVPTASVVGQYSLSDYGFHGISDAYGKLQAPTGYQAPDGKTLVAALAATWDTTGKISVTDRTAAQQTLDENFRFRQDIGSPASSAVFGNLGLSPFEQQRAAAASAFFWSPAVMSAASGNADPQPAKTELGLLNALPLEQQQLIFAGAGLNIPDSGYEGYKMVYAANLDDWKTQLAQEAVTNHTAYLANQASASAATVASAITTTVSASTAASVASSVAAASKAAKALDTLTSQKSTFSNAEVALVLMRNAAKATATAKTVSSKSTSGATASLIKSSTAAVPGAPNPAAALRMGGTVSVTA